MTSFDIIKNIVFTNKSINGIYVHDFPTAPLLDKRIYMGEVERNHMGIALDLRNQFGYPFWDGIMLSYYNQNKISQKILQSVLLHNRKREKIFIARDTLLNSELEYFTKLGINIALNSEVAVSNHIGSHLLLLDFHIPESKNNLKVVESVLKYLNVGTGYILRSGRSYHFIGNTIFEFESLLDMLSKCLFYSPIIDKSWIAHQLLERSCSLRLTSKNGVYPTLLQTHK